MFSAAIASMSLKLPTDVPSLIDASTIYKLIIINIPVAFTMLIVGFLVYFNDPKNKSNRWFLLTIGSFSIWMITRLMSDVYDTPNNFSWSRLTVSLSVLMTVSFFHFSVNYIKKTKLPKLVYLLVYTVPIFTFTCAATTDLFIKDLVFLGSNRAAFVTTKWYLLNTTTIALTSLSGLLIIYLKSRSNSEYKNQANLIFIGLILALVFNVANDIYFVISGRDVTGILHSLLSALGFLAFSLFVGYGILKKGLFDVRGAAIRWLAYVFSLAAYSLLYGMLLTLVAARLLNAKIPFQLLFLIILLSVISALTFPFMKIMFNKLTNKIFFRNDYNSAQALSVLNDSLLGRNKVTDIVSDFEKILDNILHPEQVTTLYLSKSKKTISVFEGNDIFINSNLPLDSSPPWNGKDVLAINDLTLNKSQINYVVSLGYELALRMKTEEVELGAILVAKKKNGDKYNKKDIEFLGTALKNVNLALKTALQFNQIQNFNQTLKDEINEATRKLKQTNSRITKISKAKDEMISMVSHQLIPQLTATQGFMEILEHTDENKDELLKLSRSATARMTRLAQDMLNSTKIQSGELELEKETVDLVALLQDEVKNLSYAAAKHEVNVIFNAPSKLLISVDRVKFGEAVFNIIDNAIQYSPKQSQVIITLNENELVVTDSGIGISKAELPNIAKKYYRTERAKKHRPNGSGIGLFVTANIIKKHGFGFSIISKVGKGTSIVIGIDNA